MAYSKSYQTVEAGRVREDEAIAFFGQNKISCGRVTNFVSMGGQTQPTLAIDPANEFVGKNVDLGDATSTKRNISAYKAPNVQVS